MGRYALIAVLMVGCGKVPCPEAVGFDGTRAEIIVIPRDSGDCRTYTREFWVREELDDDPESCRADRR